MGQSQSSWRASDPTGFDKTTKDGARIVPIAIVALAAALGFFSAWWVQDARYQAKEIERVQQDLYVTRTNAASSIRRADNVLKAQSDALLRNILLRNAADSARRALIGLSDATEAAMRDAKTAHSACLERTVAVSAVLNSCGAKYQELGEIADRLNNDRQTLLQAWPK